MATFPITLLLSLCALLYSLFVPGYLLAALDRTAEKLSAADIFFRGWIFNAIAISCLAPFTQSTATLSIGIKMLVALFIPSAILFGRKRNANRMIRPIPFTAAHLGILLTTVFLFSSYVSTHNLGYDDTSHLDYLYKTIHGVPFHTFITLNKYFPIEVANYPFFGAILGSIASGISGGAITIYYLTGFCTLVFFLVLCYEHALLYLGNRLPALTATALAMLCLTYLGWDNYFNFCIYPLQQSKLLFLSGLLYLVRFHKGNQNKSDLFMGFALCAAAVLHHLNLIILFFLLFAGYMLVLLCSRQKNDKAKKLLLICLLPLLATPAALLPQRGFIKFTKPQAVTDQQHAPKKKGSTTPVVSKSAKHASQQEPSLEQRWNSTTNTIDKFIKKFRKIQLYLTRSLTPEMLAIPLLLLLGGYLFQFRSLNILFQSGTVLALLVVYATTVPRQALVAFYYSNTFFMLRDIYGTNRNWDKNARYWSDPYTSLYLRLTKDLQAPSLSPMTETLAFSPLFSKGIRPYAARQADLSPNDFWVTNHRYWGLSSLTRRSDPEIQPGAAFTSSAGGLNGDRRDIFYLQTILGELAKIFRKRCSVSLEVTPVSLAAQNRNVDWSNFIVLPENTAVWHNDTAVVRVSDLAPGHPKEVFFRFHGGWIRILATIPENFPLPVLLQGNHRSRQWEEKWAGKSNYAIVTDKPLAEAFLIFRINGQGYINGLGQMQSVRVNDMPTRPCHSNE